MAFYDSSLSYILEGSISTVQSTTDFYCISNFIKLVINSERV